MSETWYQIRYDCCIYRHEACLPHEDYFQLMDLVDDMDGGGKVAQAFLDMNIEALSLMSTSNDRLRSIFMATLFTL